MKHTQGKWEVATEEGDTLVRTPAFYIARVYKGIGKDEEQANAKLIAEAGTVANETGFTPRQLAEQKAELLEACKKMQGIQDEHPTATCSDIVAAIDWDLIDAAIAAAEGE